MAKEPAGSSLSDLCVLQEVSQGLVLPRLLGGVNDETRKVIWVRHGLVWFGYCVAAWPSGWSFVKGLLFAGVVSSSWLSRAQCLGVIGSGVSSQRETCRCVL